MCLGCWTRWVGWSLVCQLQVGILTKDHYSPENWRLIHWHLQNFAISGALDTSLNASTCRLQWKSMMYPLVHKAHSCFPVIGNTLCTLILDFPSTYPRGKWIVCRWFQQKRTKQTYISRIQCEVFLLETFVAFNIKRCGNPCNFSIHIYSKFMGSSKASPTHTLRFILSEPLPVLPLGYAGCRWCKSSSASLEASTDNLRRLNRARFELQSTCIDQIDHLLDVHQASCWRGVIYIYIYTHVSVYVYLYMYPCRCIHPEHIHYNWSLQRDSTLDYRSTVEIPERWRFGCRGVNDRCVSDVSRRPCSVGNRLDQGAPIWMVHGG